MGRTHGQGQYIITQDEKECVISDFSGYLITPAKAKKIAEMLMEYANHSDAEIEEYNREIKKELDAEYNSWREIAATPKLKQKASVYLLECGGRYKVGVSQDVDRRLKELDNRPFPATIIATSGPIENAYEKEQRLHALFAKYRIKDEWYDLSMYQVGYLTKLIKSEVQK